MIVTELEPSTARWFAARRPAATIFALVGLLAVLALGVLLLGESVTRRAAWKAPGGVVAVPPPLPAVAEPTLMPVAPEAAREINAKRGFDVQQLTSARGLVFEGSPESRGRARDCLAATAWYEAGDNPVMQRSVVQVVLNRARHPAFPAATVCGTVFQGSQRVTGCQFTFTCDGSLRRVPSPAAWARARAVAEAALSGTVDTSVGNATHYHADYVVPYWAPSLDKLSKVGAHIFYKWKGYWGKPAAFSRKVGASEPAYRVLAGLSPDHAVADAVPPPPGLALPELAPTLVDETPAFARGTPLVVAGVREKSLRGALVRGAGESNTFFLQLDAGTFPGNYAIAAVALCKGKPNCVVMGWRETANMANALPLNETQRGALSFFFEQRENADGRALWNCSQSPRRNPAQCLTAPGSLSID